MSARFLLSRNWVPIGSIRREAHMADAPVILGAKERGTTNWKPRPETGWRLLLILGLAFIVAGGVDLALLWYPSQWGTPEFEFATINQFVAGLPVLTMGLVLVALHAIGTGKRGVQVVVAVLAIFMVAALAVLAVIFATTVPLALRVAELNVKTGIKKAIVRATVQFMGYGLAYLALGWSLFQASRKQA